MTNFSGNDEKLLLAQVANGDRKAFNQLYAGHIENVYRFIFLFTKSKAETDEIIQDVFVNIWDKREKLAEIQSFKNYLFIAAKNKVLSQVRHLQIKERVLGELRRTRNNSVNNPADDVVYKEYYRIVKEAIEKLPPKRKLIFRLNIENGLSYDEIAEKMHISKTVVKNQFYKGSDFVRKYLEQHGEISLILLLLLQVS